MKHIAKKFLFQYEPDQFSFESERFEVVDMKDGLPKLNTSKYQDKVALLKTDTAILGGILQRLNQRNYVFPIPDPTLVYFNAAQLNVGTISDCKANLLSKLDPGGEVAEPALNEFYKFYGLTSQFIVMLFTSVESFINSSIPEGYEFRQDSVRKTEVYNKQQIQQYLDFKTKLTKVIPDVYGINFFGNSTPTNERVWKLKDFRNEIVHTKPTEQVRNKKAKRMRRDFWFTGC